MILCKWKGTRTYWNVWWWSHQWRILHVWWLSRWDCGYVQDLHVDYFNITIDKGYGTTFWGSCMKFIFLTIYIRTYDQSKPSYPSFEEVCQICFVYLHNIIIIIFGITFTTCQGTSNYYQTFIVFLFVPMNHLFYIKTHRINMSNNCFWFFLLKFCKLNTKLLNANHNWIERWNHYNHKPWCPNAKKFTLKLIDDESNLL